MNPTSFRASSPAPGPRFPRTLRGLFLALLAIRTALGQPIPDAVFTAGTTAVDPQGRTWAYLAFRPSDDRVLAGRTLAVHAKAGLPGDPGTFQRLGVAAVESDVAVLQVYLERGRMLGEDLAELAAVVDELHRSRSGTDAPGGGADGTRPLAEQLSALVVRAGVDAETGRLLRWLGQAHPAVKMAMGEAWAGLLSAAPGQPTTFEVREMIGPGGPAGGVIGRVTLAAGPPQLLPPPGPPWQVPDLSPKGDLNIKLRWGQDDDLRRLSPLAAGFTLWRVPRAFASAQGADAAAPAPARLQAWARAGDAVRVSDGPVLVPRVLSLAEAANLAVDSTNYFVVDDGRRYRRDAAGVDIDQPLPEGAEFTYFVCTRDLLGRDGPPSLPGHGVVCRTLPPPIPGELRAANHWAPGDGADGTQAIQFSWRANLDQGRDVTHYYEVYRGTDLNELQSEPAKERLVPIQGRLPHGANGAELTWLDQAPEIAGADFGHTFWYSVRAVHESPCGPIRSDFAAPVLIARRQREGPAAPTGFVDADCHRAAVIVAGTSNAQDPAIPPNDGLVRVRLLCRRLDPGIAFVDLSARWGGNETDLGQHHFPAEGDWVAAEFSVPRNDLAGRSVVAACQATTHAGATGNRKEFALDHLTSEGRREVTFHARTLADADLVPGEPFSDECLESPVVVPAVAAPGGWAWVPSLGALDGRRVVVQTSPVAVAVPTWTRRGAGQVRDGAATVTFAPAPGQQESLSARVFPIREFGDAPCVNLAYDPGTGRAGKTGITIRPTPRTEEFRLFRRIDDGPYSLVAQGAAAHLPGALGAVRVEDDALPPTDCAICYYAQNVDRDGNASALVRLEPCLEPRSPTLPRPTLSPPLATGALAAPRMKLTWSCPPQGVERFLVTIKAKGGAAARSALEQSSTLSMTAPLAARTVIYHAAGGDLSRESTAQAAGPATAGSGASGDSARVLALPAGTLTFQKLVQTSSFLTPPLGQGYPDRPPFSAEFDVQAGAAYSVFVQAVRGPLFGGKGRGPASATYEFKWDDPTRVEPEVAWPARPLESVTVHPLLQAAELDPVLWPARLNGERPVGVRVATMPNARGEDVVQAGTEMVFAPTPDSPNHRRHDPNAHLVAGLGDGITQVQGILLYRQQVPNRLFPTTSGDTLQVSPLIRRIAWVPTRLEDGRAGARLVDPYFAILLEPPPPDRPEDPQALSLWLLDRHGVVDGARYRYFLVCLGPDGEVRRTLDAGYAGPP